MGKHEVVKPAMGATTKSTERVRKHREAMQAKGYKLKSLWILNTDDPQGRERLREESRAIAEWERNNPDEVAWMKAFADRNWETLPD